MRTNRGRNVSISRHFPRTEARKEGALKQLNDGGLGGDDSVLTKSKRGGEPNLLCDQSNALLLIECGGRRDERGWYVSLKAGAREVLAFPAGHRSLPVL